MKRNLTLLLAILLLTAGMASAGLTDVIVPAKKIDSVLCPRDGSFQEKLAAREIRRYLYARTGQMMRLVDIGTTLPESLGAGVIVAVKGSPLLNKIAASGKLKAAVDGLGEQQYLLKTIRFEGHPVVLIAGGDATGALYGAYRFAETLGVRFYLNGDVIPDQKIDLKLPDLDEQGKPLFSLRGIQPFHDFPEGPDWWSEDDYKAIIAQLPKLKMNFFGLHTYPEAKPHAEPTVWIGKPDDFNPDGTVKASYPTAYFNTHRTDWAGFNWGYETLKTGDFLYGASQLFESDVYGPAVMNGHLPFPKTPEECNDVFNRTGAMLRNVFTQAHAVGVKTCVGTEIPLTIPVKTSERLTTAKDYVGPLGGRTVTYKDVVVGNTEDSAVYNSVRYDFKGYVLPVPNGAYTVTLKFCEVSHNNPNGRVFDVSLQGKKLIEKLDIFVQAGGKNKAVDFTFNNVTVTDGKLRLGLTPIQEFPSISGIEIKGANNYSLKINCGGSAYKDYLSDEGNMLLGDNNIKMMYEGIFKRIMTTYPIDYYWFWTGEGWTWQDAAAGEVQAAAKDLQIAVQAAKSAGVPFKLATCGWVLGPSGDRTMFDRDLPKDVALSCINRQVGMAPVDISFSRIKGRPLWSIPWMEDDPTLTSVQLWAGRMRRDAADALAYGCTGLFGIHWRTRILGPNVAALAQAGWDQKSFNPYPAQVQAVADGKSIVMPGQRIGNTDEPELYRSMRVGLSAYRLHVPNGTYNVTLKFCDLLGSGRDQRQFSVRIQDRLAVDSLDVYGAAGPSTAYDQLVKNVVVDNGMLNIEFFPTRGEAMLSALVIEGKGFSKKINCGGPAYKDYEADQPALSRHLPVGDFYADWAEHQFGPEVGPQAGAIFTRIDGSLPLTTWWINGPGGLWVDARPWEQVAKDFAFVDQFAALRPAVKGPGNLERFDYWLNNFRYQMAAHHLRCVWSQFNQAMDQVKAEANAETKKKLARELALPLRKQMVPLLAEIYRYLLPTVSTPGELGTVDNWNEHTLPLLMTKPGEELAKALGEPLPADAKPGMAYEGVSRLIVPTVRGSLASGEPLSLKVQVLAKGAPTEAALYWRPMGQGEYAKIPLTHVARGVYTVQIPAGEIKDRDLEYYVKVVPEKEQALVFPATAPEAAQTVIVTPAAPSI